jgi:RNA polymerase sigma-70 factor (ECF subfamily)
MDDPVASNYRRHRKDVEGFIGRRASIEDVGDLTQEVFASAVAALASGRLHAEPPLAWLYTVARRRLIDLARRRQVEAVPLDVVEVPAEERTYGPRLAEQLRAALDAVSEAQRRVIVLKVLRGCSFAEIAAILGCSEEACRMRFSRGLLRLREELERKGVGT